MPSSENTQTGRWRCLAVGCNPPLNEATAAVHKTTAGHRVAAWPVRSAEGKRRAKVRNKTGYYDKYNVGAKAVESRGVYNSGDGNVATVTGRDSCEHGWMANDGFGCDCDDDDNEYAFGEDDF